MLNKVCEFCKKEFKPDKAKRRFCSVACFGKYQEIHSPFHKKGQHPKTEFKKGCKFEFKKGHIAWNKGLPKKQQPMFGKKLSKETKQKISQSKKEKGISEETLEKMKGNKYALGYKHTEEDKIKIAESSRKRVGEKGSNWQGGKSFEPYSTDWTEDLKESIRKRDNYICQECGIHQDELNKKLDCHHIDYDKDNLDSKNLITLCRSCHMKTNGNRDYWTNYFK